MTLVFLCTLSVILGSIVLEETDARDVNAVDFGFDYIQKSEEDSPKELFTEPTNSNSSLQYALYTPYNPEEACYFEPTPEGFDNCPFDPSLKTKFLIHGFLEYFKPGNLFEEMKDAMLDDNEYNIIIVNWTLYNNFPYLKVVENIPKVGNKVADTGEFLIRHKGMTPEQFHCIGHSYGAHICGIAARRIPNFNRVSALDPGGVVVLFSLLGMNIVLHHTDADYVDVIHTSAIETGIGLGIIQPIGDIDIYVNGGINQKHCKFGREYKLFKGDIAKVETPLGLAFCNHDISIVYYTNSVRDGCEFLATKCPNFLSALLTPFTKQCLSNSRLTAKMGFHSKKIERLPPGSVFYVDTLEFPPYCKERN